MKTYAVLLIGFCGAIANSQFSPRFYFAHGDSATASANQQAIGQEIASGSALKVNAGSNFKVQLWLDLSGIQTPGSLSIFSTNIAFDRSVRGQGEAWNFLDENAFRKIAPSSPNLSDNISNFQEFAAYQFGGTVPLDGNGDGIQDRASWQVTGGQGVDLLVQADQGSPYDQLAWALR
jgi:hypothetical protein